MHYRVVRAEGARGPWKIETAAYSYSIREAPDRELLRYDWHPAMKEEGRAVAHPHLHTSAGGVAGKWLHKAHLPTGRVALEDILQLLLTDLGVRPRRDDWERVLARTRIAFMQWRTWQ
jgi:hypothetical protein